MDTPPIPQDLRAQLRTAYDRQAAVRAARHPQAWKQAQRARFLAMLQQAGAESLLELGAGPGGDSLFFQNQGLKVVCIDLSPEMVRLCRQKGLAAQVMDMAALQFSSASFDAVYALNSLLHLPKTEFPTVLRQVERVLRPGGLFYLGVYGGYAHEGVFPEDDHAPKRFFSFYSDEALRQAAGEVFELLVFERVILDAESDIHFQSVFLRKPVGGSAAA